MAFALCTAAAAGDADLDRVLHRPAVPPAPVDDALGRLTPGLERLLQLSAGILGADVAAVTLAGGVWCWHASEARLRQRAGDVEPAELVDDAQATASAQLDDGRGRLTVISAEPRRRFSGRELALVGTLADAVGAALRAPPDIDGDEVTRIADQIEALAGSLGPARGELRWRGTDFVALVAAVGRRARLADAEQAELELAARLLDVGLLRAPDELLARPGPLSATERRLLRNHVRWGAEVLLHVPGLAAVAVIVLSHHERWDGTGYPHGLAGDRIPAAARVLAACDSWWAMTSRRPFADPLAPEDAAAALVAARGRQFDREMVEAVLAEVAGATLVA